MSTEADRRARPKAKCVQDLEVYRIAYRLVIELYRDSAAFPSDERYGLTSQIRRAAVSIPANIAEGFRRAGLREKAHFLNIAQASLEEVRTLLCLAHDLRLCPPSHLLGELAQLARMLHSYRVAIVQKLGRRETGDGRQETGDGRQETGGRIEDAGGSHVSRAPDSRLPSPDS